MIGFIRGIRDAWYLSGVVHHTLNSLPLHGSRERAMVEQIVTLHAGDLLSCRDAGVSPRLASCTLAETIWARVMVRAKESAHEIAH